MGAVSYTNDSNPNQQILEGEFLGMKARVINVTFAASYTAAGDTLTAAALGWSQVYGFIPLTSVAAPSGQATAASFGCTVNAAKTTLSFQLYNENDAAAYAQRPRQATAQAASNNATFVVRGIVLGS